MGIYPTIAEALTLGGSQLAVDGLVLVGEHGSYPRNEKGQTRRLKVHHAAYERSGSRLQLAAHVEGQRRPWSTQMYLPMPDGRTTLGSFFSPLVNNAEKMYLTGKPTYPVQRTLLTTGLTAAGVDSLCRKRERFDTPYLAITYEPRHESTFWRT